MQRRPIATPLPDARARGTALIRMGFVRSLWSVLHFALVAPLKIVAQAREGDDAVCGTNLPGLFAPLTITASLHQSRQHPSASSDDRPSL